MTWTELSSSRGFSLMTWLETLNPGDLAQSSLQWLIQLETRLNFTVLIQKPWFHQSFEWLVNESKLKVVIIEFLIWVQVTFGCSGIITSRNESFQWVLQGVQLRMDFIFMLLVWSSLDLGHVQKYLGRPSTLDCPALETAVTPCADTCPTVEGDRWVLSNYSSSNPFNWPCYICTS